MAKKVIKIFDPKEKPFGALSNNFVKNMELDDKRWRTVTNYIYANILTTPRNINYLKNKKKDVKATFHLLFQEEVENVVKLAIPKALDVKFKNDKELAERLLATGNSPIVYVSDNPLLGIGTKNDSQNVYGKYLMQIRHILRTSFKKQKQEIAKTGKDQLIYDIYLANVGLMNAIRQGNDLKEYINKTPSEIIEMIGRMDLEKIAPDRATVLEMEHKKYLDKGLLKAIDYPEALVPLIRKKEMRNLRLRRIRERKEIIFDMYVDYLLEKHFSDLHTDQYPKAKEQQLRQMGSQQKNDLENRLYDLFKKDMLSSRLSDKIDKKLADVHIPTEEDVKEAESVQINYEGKPVAVEEEMYVPERGSPILVYNYKEDPRMDPKYQKYVDFSPISFTEYLNIEGKIFPTVSHYIIARNIAHIPSEKGGGGFGEMEKAWPQLLTKPEGPFDTKNSFLQLNDAEIRYQQLRDISYRKNLEKYAKKGMDKKFEDRVLQDLLLNTGNAKLVYNDFSDPILGVGGKQDRGLDFVGKYLMKLRTQYTNLRKGETLRQLSSVDITSILMTDFMNKWLNRRVKDMCRVLMVMKNYLYTKDKIDNKLNADFTTTVLDKIYQPCSQVFGATNLITAEVPKYFQIMVQECPGFSKVTYETIEVMWKRIAVIIYYLTKHIKESNTQNIKTVLMRIELLVTKGGQCVEIIPDSSNYHNCIVSALINLLYGIIKFNDKFSLNTTVTKQDVKTATSIILNSDVYDEVMQTVPVPASDKPSGWVSKISLVPQGGKVEDEQELVFSDDDSDSDERENDYGEELGNEDDKAKFSSPKNMLISFLEETIEEVKNPKDIALAIEDALKNIKEYPMPKQVKSNRINFFATQRDTQFRES